MYIQKCVLSFILRSVRLIWSKNCPKFKKNVLEHKSQKPWRSSQRSWVVETKNKPYSFGEKLNIEFWFQAMSLKIAQNLSKIWKEGKMIICKSLKSYCWCNNRISDKCLRTSTIYKINLCTTNKAFCHSNVIGSTSRSSNK